MNNLIKYGFSLGRVHVLEQGLLSQNDYDRLLEADSFKEKLHILSETIYAPYIDQATDEESIEESLAEYMATLYQLVDELFDNEPIREYFRQQNNYHQRLVLAKQSKISLLIKLAQLDIDIANIKIWLRQKPGEINDFLEGGLIDRKDFLSEDIEKRIVQICPPIARALEGKALLLDENLDECMLLILEQYKYEPDTPDRITAFLKAKELEVKNVRHILFGGLNDIKMEAIQENLRYLYA